MSRRTPTPHDPVDDVVEEFMARSVRLLRELLRERIPAPRRRSALVTTEAPGDVELADDVTRARARELIDRHAKRKGQR